MIGNKVYIIAEIGTSHSGDINKAKALVLEAKEAGADCVKFQYVIADEIVHKNSGYIKLENREVNIYNEFKKVEMPFSFYKEIKDFCDLTNIDFLCSGFGAKSIEMIDKLGVKYFKVASPEINHYPMLEYINTTDIPCIISTGVCKKKDIDNCIDFLENKFCLLQCVTQYPAKYSDYNISVLKTLKKRYNCDVGVSDHTKDPILVPALSVLFGGKIIEKHFKLEDSTSGLDDNFALNKTQFTSMVKTVRSIENKSFSIKSLYKMYGKKLVKKTLGSKKIKLSKNEKKIYITTNRSIIAIKDINKGDIIDKNNVDILRSEQNKKSGLNPKYLKKIYNKRVKKNIPDGTGIQKKHIKYY